MIGLPVILARYGIPNANRLKDEELKTLNRWVSFANVPKETLAKLNEFEEPSSEEVLTILRIWIRNIFEYNLCPE